ncbi:hypothetical protein DL96DRAFT_1701727 [Flagelloscypha sp. PMI_526]|nr:hypothetical protein DL96DRAFT_1701727 [Flagelloscypha sp. PMI_526]
MVTPREGTVQHQDLEALPPYSKSGIWFHYGKPTASILAWIAGVCAYNVSTCALGRFFLDHFHLWTRIIPSDAPTLDKHAELIVALLAGCLSIPLTILTYVIVDDLDRMLWVQGYRFQFTNIDNIIVWILVVALLTLFPATAALIHLKFHHVTPVSTLAVFGFGSLITLPSSLALIACFARK